MKFNSLMCMFVLVVVAGAVLAQQSTKAQTNAPASKLRTLSASPVNHDYTKGLEDQRKKKQAEIKVLENTKNIGAEGKPGSRGQYRQFMPGDFGNAAAKGRHVSTETWNRLAAEHKAKHMRELQKDLADIEAKLTRARELAD